MRVIWLGLLVGILGLSDLARAAEQDPETLIREGNALRSRRQDDRALGLFKRAYDIARTPRTAAQLGLCEFALQSYVDAINHFSEALASHDTWIEQNRPQLEKVAEQLKTHIAQIDVSGTPPGAVIALDDRLVGTLPAARAWSLPGHISVKAKAPGYADDARILDVAGGERRELQFDLKPIVADVAATRVHSEPEPQSRSTSAPVALTVAQPKSGSFPRATAAETPARIQATPESTHPIYRRWWFWTVVGAVVVTGTGVALAVTHPWRSSPTCDASPCTVW